MNASDDGSTAHDASVLLATAGYDHTIRFWDVLQGTCLATLQHNESVSVHAAHPRSLMSSTQQVNCMAISPDKRYLAVAGNPNVRLFGVQETLQTARSLQMDAAHLGANADSTQRAVSPEAAGMPHACARSSHHVRHLANHTLHIWAHQPPPPTFRHNTFCRDTRAMSPPLASNPPATGSTPLPSMGPLRFGTCGTAWRDTGQLAGDSSVNAI